MQFEVLIYPGFSNKVFSIVLPKLFWGCTSYYNLGFKHCVKTLGLLIGSRIVADQNLTGLLGGSTDA